MEKLFAPIGFRSAVGYNNPCLLGMFKSPKVMGGVRILVVRSIKINQCQPLNALLSKCLKCVWVTERMHLTVFNIRAIRRNGKMCDNGIYMDSYKLL